MDTILGAMLGGVIIGLIVGFPITIIIYNRYREKRQKDESNKAFKEVI